MLIWNEMKMYVFHLFRQRSSNTGSWGLSQHRLFKFFFFKENPYCGGILCGWMSVEDKICITVDGLTSLTVLICLAHNLLVLKKGRQTLLHARRFTSSPGSLPLAAPSLSQYTQMAVLGGCSVAPEKSLQHPSRTLKLSVAPNVCWVQVSIFLMLGGPETN